ncbi:hypothetical protein LTR53_016382 [Teratosphaeriaceae sp. CCFEE 6253]|nr:hypothetical protein LTR53_016382 [Teratosphaeriaceae sp. CCFEE 6253]
MSQDDLISEDVVAAACERKDRESVRLLLASGWPIDKPVQTAASLLCIAVEDADFTQWPVHNGADVNATSSLDETALSVAVARGSMETVRCLLSQGADIAHGVLLHCVAQRGDQVEGAELVVLLVQRGADVNSYRYNNPIALRWRGPFKLPTPLHVANDHRNLPVTQALLRNGADPHRKMLVAGTPASTTPLEIWYERNDQALIALLHTATLPAVPA